MVKKIYNSFDIVRIPFNISPVLIAIYFFVEILRAIISTFGIVYATSVFVNNVTEVMNGNLEIKKMYIALTFLILVSVVGNLLESFVELIEARLKINLQIRLEPQLLKRRASLKYKYIEDADSWDLIERLSEDLVLNIQSGLKSIMIVLKSIISLSTILLFVFIHVWWASIVILLLSIPLFIFSFRAGLKNYNAWVEAWPYERRYSYYSDEILTSREATQERTLFGYSEYIADLHIKHFEIARKIQEKVAVRTKISTELTGIFMSLIGLLIAFSLVDSYLAGGVSPGTFVGVISAVFSMATTIGGTLQVAAREFSYAKNSMGDLTKFMDLETQNEVLTIPDKNPPFLENISFKSVSFKYPNTDKYILKNMSFDIHKNKHYAFVGKNGSGKTTIIKLLSGLYDEYEGEILINGKELRTYEKSTLKSIFSIAYQDFSKYNISLYENIAIGNLAREQSLEEINLTASKAGLEETIRSLKEGIKTNLGKIHGSGSDLSGGQWQKIAIARSLISEAPIKILDEPTANLDPISESLIYKNFEEIMAGKTTIFISHRLGSTKLADEILVIDQGKIVEKGSHDKLMSKNGLYAEMFNKQRGWYDEK
ncbi:MAG: ABC transporter ATP-binding protein [Gemella sp.]|nr:ABC transporter ATP-binding protein [Gemella sp.]